MYDVLRSCFSSYTVNKCALPGLFRAMYFAYLCLSLVISLFKTAIKCTADVLSNVPKHKKSVMCLMEKTQKKKEISFVQAWLIVQLAVSLMLVNQQYMF